MPNATGETLQEYQGLITMQFEYTPPPTYPEPRTPEEVRELLGPTDSEHQAEAI